MRSAVTPAAAPSPTTTLARRVRALRIALALGLVVAVPLIVALGTHQSRTGTKDAYREQARADAISVGRVAAQAPPPALARELERLRRSNADVRGIAVYRRTGGVYR